MNLPRGRRIISEKISEIGTIYDRIPEDFEGSVRIFMKFEGGLHRGDLLIGGSNILCVSLDDLDKGGSIYGEEAFGEIKKRISGAVGDVDVYIFNDTEMSLAIRTNEMILLKPVLSLSRFSELASVPAEKGAVRAAEKGAVRAAEKGAVRAAEKG
ncbi:MAG: hypothetical protein JW778_02570, partial [Candidatus Altiarchaeota archaeon]|nr:hypothetical protein [Candidatus Altiarchaeota archaeon]